MQQAAFHTAGDREYRSRNMPGQALGSKEHNHCGDIAGGAGGLLLILVPHATHHNRHYAPPKARNQTACLERDNRDRRRDL